MNDPDGNGVELYWDKPKDEWPVEADGSLNMFTRASTCRICSPKQSPNNRGTTTNQIEEMEINALKKRDGIDSDKN